MGLDVAFLLFVLGKVLSLNFDPYFELHLETTTTESSFELQLERLINQLKISDPFRVQSILPPLYSHLKSQTCHRSVSLLVLDSPILLDEYGSHDQSSDNCYIEDGFLYYIDRITRVYQLCILSAVAEDVIVIAYGEKHPGFARYRKIVSHSWFIKELTRIFQAYIQYCPKCLALYTWRHPPYKSLQPIYSSSVSFFILTLDFILALSLSPKDYNAQMLVICKFSKRVILVPSKDTWFAVDCAYALLARLDLID